MSFRYSLSKITIALISFVPIFSCKNKEDKTVKPVSTDNIAIKQLVFDKLLGTWQNPDDKSFERWTKNDNGTYLSVVFRLKRNDTLWEEHANIYPENNNWVYENAVKNQNQGKAIRFTSTLLNDSTVQFSNPEHDFPTDINYTVINNDSVHAFIIGPNNKSGKDTISYNYSRVK